MINPKRAISLFGNIQHTIQWEITYLLSMMEKMDVRRFMQAFSTVLVNNNYSFTGEFTINGWYQLESAPYI